MIYLILEFEEDSTTFLDSIMNQLLSKMFYFYQMQILQCKNVLHYLLFKEKVNSEIAIAHTLVNSYD